MTYRFWKAFVVLAVLVAGSQGWAQDQEPLDPDMAREAEEDMPLGAEADLPFGGEEDVAAGSQTAAGSQDVYYASRPSLDAPWSEPVNLSVTVPLDTGEASETRASFSWDRSRVNYGSGGQIYFIERFKIRGRQ